MWIMRMAQGLVLLSALIAKRTSLGAVGLGMQLIVTRFTALFSLLGVLLLNKGERLAQKVEPSKFEIFCFDGTSASRVTGDCGNARSTDGEGEPTVPDGGRDPNASVHYGGGKARVPSD